MRLRRLLLALVAFVLVVWAIHALYGYLFFGRITVTANGAQTYVSITRLKDKKLDPTTKKESLNKLNLLVRPGEYEVSSYNHSFTVSRHVIIRAKQHVSFSLNLTNPATAESVLGSNVNGLVADSSQMTFIDSGGHLVRIGLDNTYQTLSAVPNLVSGKWATASLGIIEDSSNNLFVFQDGQLSSISLPFKGGADDNTSYDIASSGDIYINHNGTVYAGTAQGGFSQIYKSSYRSIGLAAATDRVALTIVGSDDQEGVQAGNASPEIVVLSRSGEKLASRSGLAGYKPVWSGDGKHLLMKSDVGTMVFSQDLKNYISVPAANIGDTAWIDNTSFAYSNKDTVWKYTLSGGQSAQISTSLGGAIDAIYPSLDSSYVYLVAENGATQDGNNDAPQVSKVGLKGQSAPDYLNSLNVFFPILLTECSVSYSNFTKPVLLISPFSTDDLSECLTPLEKTLRDYQVDFSKFSLFTLPVTQDGD